MNSSKLTVNAALSFYNASGVSKGAYTSDRVIVSFERGDDKIELCFTAAKGGIHSNAPFKGSINNKPMHTEDCKRYFLLSHTILPGGSSAKIELNVKSV